LLIEPSQILESLKYDEGELETVKLMALAAEALLKGAGAYRLNNDMCPLVVMTMVGFWMSNRESEYTDYKDVKDFPLGITALITSLQYSPPDPVDVVIVDVVE